MIDSISGEVQPWLLLGERRRRALEDRIGAAAKRWAAHWVARTVTLSITVESMAAGHSKAECGDRQTIHFGARGKSGEWIAELGVPRRLVAWAAGLGVVEFSAAADVEDVSPAGEVELDVIRGLWSTLMTPGMALEAPLESLDDAHAGEARQSLVKHGLRMLCVFGPAPGCSIQVTLSAATAAMLLAERRTNFVGDSLTARRTALGQAPVALDCCLGSVQVPVRDLHSLRVGDVLVTDISLDGHAELRVRNKTRSIAVGTIGEVAGRKAIKVETEKQVVANRGMRR